MRVVVISHAYLSEGPRAKLRGIATEGRCEVILISPTHGAEGSRTLLATPQADDSLKVIVAPTLFAGHDYAYVYPSLSRLLKRLRPDILHLEVEPGSLMALHVVRNAGINAKILLFSWENILQPWKLPNPRAFIYPAIEKRVFRRVDAIQAGNQEAVEVLRRKGYQGPIHVVPQFGVDPDFYTPSPERRQLDGFTVGYLGRLQDFKGLDTLLEAISALPPWIRLLVVGNGPYKAEMERLITKLRLMDRVEMRPGVPFSQVPNVLRSMDALVLPSKTIHYWKEQFGRVLIEAMACGVPVIGSDSGEIPHVIGSAGLVFPEGDAHLLAAQIARLWQDSELHEQLRQDGRERAISCFSTHKIVKDTLRIYSELLHGNRALAGRTA